MEATEHQIQQAKATYAALCKMLDTRDWRYQKDEENLVINSGVKGEDLPIEFKIKVIPTRQIVLLTSCLPIQFPTDKLTEGAIAICVANYGLGEGNFDYDFSDGSIFFRCAASFRESLLSDDLFEYMIMVSATTIDRYNDQFFAIAKGLMTLEQFIAKEKNE